MNETAMILTHGDLDGLVSAILLLRITSRDASIKVTNGKHLAAELARVAKHPPGQVFIADIPLVASESRDVVAAIQQLTEAGAGVHVYDHHVGWNDSSELSAKLKTICSTFAIDCGKTTAAAVVWRERLRGDSVGGKWLRLLSEKNESSDPETVQHFGLLCALLQRRNFHHTEAVLKVLAFGDSLTDEHEALADWYYQQHVPRERKIAQEAETFTTSHGHKVAWIDLRQFRDRLNVVRHVVQQHDVDLVVQVVHDAVLAGGQSIDRGIDLSFLHGVHEVSGMRFTVVGHKSPIRIAPEADGLTDEFISVIRCFLIEVL